MAEEPNGLQAAVALENVLVDAIAKGEKSVVAIARVDAEQAGDPRGVEVVPGPFGRLPRSRLAPSPGDPDFIPDEFATGVVVDRRGLILTYYHVLGLKSQHYVTTSRAARHRSGPDQSGGRSGRRAIWAGAEDRSRMADPDAAVETRGPEEGADQRSAGQSVRDRPRWSG